MTATLLLRCAGPMQSWGTRSRFSHRDTETEPSKSGVVGLLAAALGRPRGADLRDLASLEMAVRIDAPGHIEVDYQTALSVARASGSGSETVLSHRHFLADADFLVALSGPEDLLRDAHVALRRPHWPLFLGRRSHVPGESPYLRGGLVSATPREALRSFAWPDGAERLEAVLECGPGESGDARLDVPVSFAVADRQYTERRIRREWLTPEEVPL